MIGSIIGDIVGSRFEFEEFKSKEFKLFTDDCDFTDDTICTIATADWIMRRKKESISYQDVLRWWCHKYNTPMGGYGGGFARWLHSSDPQPYNSWGNSSAMRVTPVGWAFDTLEETLEVAKMTAEITHNHPEGIKGAQATVSTIFMARNGARKKDIKEYVEITFGYDLSRSCEDIRPDYKFNESCQHTVPEAIVSFLDSDDFEDAIRLAISLGGDADTLACITGGIAEAYYKNIPNDILKSARSYLTIDIKNIIANFSLYCNL